jgi:hypothetical protein
MDPAVQRNGIGPDGTGMVEFETRRQSIASRINGF